MNLNAFRCKHCKTVFDSNFESCPTCGKTSPHGSRNRLLKWIAVLVFALVVAFITHLLMHTPPGAT